MPHNIVKCPKCNNVIGHVIEADHVVLLHIGGAVTKTFHGACVNCGYMVHWSVSDLALSKLIEKIYCNREKSVV